MKNIFVYGTLMRGERASGILGDCTYKGEYVLSDYALYDLGPFPGIKEQEGEEVIGEVYEIHDSVIPRMDHYEGEGELYKRTVVNVKNEKECIDDVYVYVYLGKVSGNIVRSKWSALNRLIE